MTSKNQPTPITVMSAFGSKPKANVKSAKASYNSGKEGFY